MWCCLLRVNIFRYVDECLNGHSNETARRGARNDRYHVPLPDPKGAGQNRTDYGNDSVRVFVVFDRGSLPLSGLSRGSQVDAEGRLGG